MRTSILDILCCPLCQGSLILHSCKLKEDTVVEGVLKCSACGEAYLIENSLPNFTVKPCLGLSNRIQKLFYNIYAPLYDGLERKLAKSLGFSEEELRIEVVSRMDIEEGNIVLEVCIGTGGNIPYYRKYTRGLIVGIDISEKMLSLCRDKIREEEWSNVELFLGCAEYLPFKDKVFDRVLIGGGISYFSDPTRALREAARVINDEGVVVIYEQVTLLEKILRKDKPPVNLLPPNLSLLETDYIFNKRFYVMKTVKQASS